LAATLRIERIGTHLTPETVRSGTDGRFHVRLTPGTYEVRALPQNGSFYPRPPASLRVRVVSARFTRVTLIYDTGIR
jgi:hypothetical protein